MSDDFEHTQSERSDEGGESQAGMTSTPLTVGVQLRSMRVQRGLSVEAIAAALRIREARVQAIEEDRFDDFVARVFPRGHVEQYARLLSLDERAILRVFDQQWPVGQRRDPHQIGEQPPTGIEMRIQRHKSTIVGVFALLALLVVLGALWILLAEQAQATVPAEWSVLATDQVTRSDLPTTGSASANSVSRAPSSAAMELFVAPSSQKELSDDTDGRQVRSRVSVSVLQSSYVGIWDRFGVVLHDGAIEPTVPVDIHGEPPFRIVIEDVDKTRLSLDGQPVSLQAHTVKNSARLVVRP